MDFQVFGPYPARFSDGRYWSAFITANTGDAETYGAPGGRSEPRIFVPDRKRQDHGSAGDRHAPMMTPDDAA